MAGSHTSSPPSPVFVPIALPLDEAMAAFNACRAVFAQLTVAGKAGEAPALARAMYGLGKAIDERTGHGEHPLDPEGHEDPSDG
jgi:hypothetical protein